MYMLIISLLAWWYGPGWKKLGRGMISKLALAEDFFSIDLLLATLFSPFRQISADGRREGTLQMKLQAVFDKLFSRFVGFVVRTLLIIAGAAWLLILSVLDFLVLLAWPLLPLLPIIGLIVGLTGWLPWNR